MYRYSTYGRNAREHGLQNMEKELTKYKKRARRDYPHINSTHAL